MEYGSAPRPVRQCRAKLVDLADAMTMINHELKAYLDMETGEVLYISSDARRELERICETVSEDVWRASEEEQQQAIAAAIEAYSPHYVEKEELVDAGRRRSGARRKIYRVA